MRHHRIDYVELTVTDLERAKRFYAEAFGWPFTDWGPDYAAFDDGRLQGGLRADVPWRAGGSVLVIFYSDDLADTRRRVEAAGGTVVSEHEFPGGRRFHFLDPSGNELAVWTEVPA